MNFDPTHHYNSYRSKDGTPSKGKNYIVLFSQTLRWRTWWKHPSSWSLDQSCEVC